MIITRGYAKKLIRQGKAMIAGHVGEGSSEYTVVDRYDLCRTDHVKGYLEVADETKIHP